MAQVRERQARKRGWPFWEAFGLAVRKQEKMVVAAGMYSNAPLKLDIFRGSKCLYSTTVVLLQ